MYKTYETSEIKPSRPNYRKPITLFHTKIIKELMYCHQISPAEFSLNLSISLFPSLLHTYKHTHKHIHMYTQIHTTILKVCIISYTILCSPYNLAYSKS